MEIAEVCCVSLLYWLFALVVLYPPDEAVAAGLTVEALASSWLGSETFGFIQYHIRRSATTRVVHSALIPGFITALGKFVPWFLPWMAKEVHEYAAVLLLGIFSVPFFLMSLLVLHWKKQNWQNHPLVSDLKLYVPENSTSPNAWVSVASSINAEFRRVDKFSTKANSVCRVIATDSWLIKVTAYRIHVLHQRDAVLSLESSVNQLQPHNLAMDTQQLSIKVTSIKDGISSFYINLTSEEYRELGRKIVNPVVNAREVVVQQTLSDRFLTAFAVTVTLNPKVSVTDEIDVCIGCMEVVANVKLQRRCTEGANEEQHCVDCYCRPMWCLSCLSKWFAARQNQDRPETWLGSRAPCPTCRSTFCLLDVSLIL